MNSVRTGDASSRVRMAYLSARMASSTTTCLPSAPPYWTHIRDSSSSKTALMVPSTLSPLATNVRPSAALAVKNAVVPSVDQSPGASSTSDGSSASHWKEVRVSQPCPVASAELRPSRNRSHRAIRGSVAVADELMALLGWRWCVGALSSTMHRAAAFPEFLSPTHGVGTARAGPQPMPARAAFDGRSPESPGTIHQRVSGRTAHFMTRWNPGLSSIRRKRPPGLWRGRPLILPPSLLPVDRT
ncbi:hypothetical protein PJL18_02141 [Paenarthrobacter nicotinovorans]|nr:hypothetical protein [Paenarthrobacter nicotinovorans]